MRWSIAARIVMVVAVLLGGFVSYGESATLRSFNFSGFLDEVNGTPFGLPLNLGNPISGTVTYDADSPVEFSYSDVNFGETVVYTQLEGLGIGVTALFGGKAYSSRFFQIYLSEHAFSFTVNTISENGNPVFLSNMGFFNSTNIVKSTALVDFDPTTFQTIQMFPGAPDDPHPARFFILDDYTNPFPGSLGASINFSAGIPSPSPNLPFLPHSQSTDSSTDTTTFTFSFTGLPGGGYWLDPPFTNGFTYELDSGAFREVGAPPAYFGFGPLDIIVDDMVIKTLNPDEHYLFGPDITTFTVKSQSAIVDTANPAAFPLFVDFTGSPTTLTMTSLALPAAPGPDPVPEPSTWLLLATGLAGVLGYGWKKRAV